jgi:hypothetical protein
VRGGWQRDDPMGGGDSAVIPVRGQQRDDPMGGGDGQCTSFPSMILGWPVAVSFR